MQINDIIKYLEEWAPKAIAWDGDNVGLQVGDRQNEITNILLSLDFNENVLKQAIKKKCNLIITHHPFIFTPIKKLNFGSDLQSKLIKELIQNNISLYSAHTNLDFTKDGVSFELAKTLGLKNIQFLKTQEGNQFKLVVYIPEASVEVVANAIFNAGGGIIGEYAKCSARNSIIGTFEGSGNSNPSIGTKNTFEQVNEVRLEVLVDSWKLDGIILAMKAVHPYEEPAFDVFVIKNKNINYGSGAIGELESSMTQEQFLKNVKKLLKAESLRYACNTKSKIKKIAVCGGSCSDMLKTAISQNADAFITADVKYHTFQDAEDKILLIDAGHYETEVPILKELKSKLNQFVKINKTSIKIFKYSGSTNPIKFYYK